MEANSETRPPPDEAGQSVALNLPDPSQPTRPAAQIRIAVDLPPGSQVRITVESLAEEADGSPPARIVIESAEGGEQPVVLTSLATIEAVSDQRQPAPVVSAPGWRDRLRRWPYTLETTLFGLALTVYLLTRLIGLAQFPIYFFTDEAIQTVAAADLIRDNFRNEEKTLLPTYFKNGPFYNLSASVYLQVLPYVLFGKSVFVTRAVSVLVGTLAAISIGLILRDIYKIPYWWAGVSLLSIAPAWFLHSRTAFETVIFVSFYALFLYLYLLYRYRSPRYLNWAILAAALAFYSYSPGQLVMGATALLLLISDGRYHWENRKTLLRGLGVAILLALPYIRFRWQHQEAPLDHLRLLGSYWVQPMPLRDKISKYWSEYFYGLSPSYWFIPNDRDLPRHLMKGYGNLLRWTLPFAAVGLFLVVKGLRSSANRAVLIAMLMAPLGSALVQIGITRTLVYIIPATILTALGISKILTWLETKKAPRPALSIGLFILLTFTGFYMLRDALIHAPYWYHDYGLGGMEYGARQIFPEIKSYLEKSPTTHIILSPSWANGTDVVARFFFPDPLPFEMGSIDGHIFQRRPLDENTLFVMTPEEYRMTVDSGKFTDIRVEQTLPYPNGQPGFIFLRLRYVDDIDQILAAEREARRVLRGDVINLDGQMVPVRYSMLDMGEIGQMFDGNLDTVARTLEANPAVIELNFPKPRSISEISAIIGSTQAEVKAIVYPNPDATPVEFAEVLQGTIDHPRVTLKLGETVQASKLRLEIHDIHHGEPGHIHIWEIELK